MKKTRAKPHDPPEVVKALAVCRRAIYELVREYELEDRWRRTQAAADFKAYAKFASKRRASPEKYAVIQAALALKARARTA